jgi:hypothetical protein
MNDRKQGSMTAADLQAKLAKDPEYQAMLQEKLANVAAFGAILDADEELLLQELSAVGVPVNSVWDLVNSPGPYPEAIPVLLKHLDVDHHPRTREGIVRSLICPDSRGIATSTLMKHFEAEADSESQLKWLLGSALSESATPDNVSQLVELVRDKRHGKGRTFLPFGLLQLPEEEARTILTELLQDSITHDSAKKALKKLNKRRG